VTKPKPKKRKPQRKPRRKCPGCERIDWHPSRISNGWSCRCGLDTAYQKPKPKKQLPPAYTGRASIEFWARISKLKNPQAHDALYFSGVILQETEARVLRWLDNAERGLW